MKKKAILWFYKGSTIKEDIEILDYFDSLDYEIHIFNDVDESNLIFDNIFYMLNILFENNLNDYEIYIASNIKEFILIEYILYKQWINGFLYLNTNSQHININEFYDSILSNLLPITSGKNFFTIKDEEEIFNDFNVLKKPYEFKSFDNNFENEIYYINGKNHIFSYKSNLASNIIKVDTSEFNKNDIYVYHYNLNYVDDFISRMKYFASLSADKFIENYVYLESVWDEINNTLTNKNSFELNLVKHKLERYLIDPKENDKFTILLYSALINLFHEQKYIDIAVQKLINSKTLTKENKFFCYYQIKRYVFLENHLDIKVYELLKILYDNIFEEYTPFRKSTVISKDQRNEKLVFVFISQFLSEHHSPSKVALETCYNLIKYYNKNVILINTKECLTLNGIIPMFNITRGNVVEEFSSVNSISYKDVIIPFYQPSVSMPDEYEIKNILNSIKKNNPYFIINIGQSIVGDIASRIAPTVTISLGMNEYSRSNFHVIYDEQDKELYMNLYNFSEENLIVSKFGFEIKNQEQKFNKKQLSIPNNKFILSVIGNRLNFELDEDFLSLLDQCCNELNVFVVFISSYEFDSEKKNQYKYLYENSKSLGFQNDLLAIMDHVDLFVNPKRKGGGSSAIYSLYKGKPVVTLNYGDVAKNVGSDFYCETYSEMFDLIKKYYLDKNFYLNQSAIAKEKALVLTDTKIFTQTILDFLNNVL